MNGTPLDAGVTPVSYDAKWGDNLVLNVPGNEPRTLVLADGMAGLSKTDDGLTLRAEWPKPLSITTSAEAAAVLLERMPQAWALQASLNGLPSSGEPSVAVGSPFKFSIDSARGGYLLMAHLGADDSLSLIYPTPEGTPLGVSAAMPTPIGAELGLVASEPLGSEWFVFLVTPEPGVPPEIAGRTLVEGKAARYAFGPGESPGRAFVLWLLDTFQHTDAATAIIPIEVVKKAVP